MEERKCQMSWSSKKDNRMQSLLCSRDSAGVFCQEKEIKTFSAYEINKYFQTKIWQVCVRVTDLPGAESLEEEIQCKAPHHSSEENAHQRQTLNSLPAPQLKMHKKTINLQCTQHSCSSLNLNITRTPSWWCKRQSRAAGCRWQWPTGRRQSH